VLTYDDASNLVGDHTARSCRRPHAAVERRPRYGEFATIAVCDDGSPSTFDLDQPGGVAPADASIAHDSRVRILASSEQPVLNPGQK